MLIKLPCKKYAKYIYLPLFIRVSLKVKLINNFISRKQKDGNVGRTVTKKFLFRMMKMK